LGQQQRINQLVNQLINQSLNQSFIKIIPIERIGDRATMFLIPSMVE